MVMIHAENDHCIHFLTKQLSASGDTSLTQYPKMAPMLAGSEPPRDRRLGAAPQRRAGDRLLARHREGRAQQAQPVVPSLIVPRRSTQAGATMASSRQ